MKITRYKCRHNVVKIQSTLPKKKKKHGGCAVSKKKKKKRRLSVINRSNYAYPQERVCVLRLGRASSSNVPFTIKKTRWCVQYVWKEQKKKATENKMNFADKSEVSMEHCLCLLFPLFRVCVIISARPPHIVYTNEKWTVGDTHSESCHPPAWETIDLSARRSEETLPLPVSLSLSVSFPRCREQ